MVKKVSFFSFFFVDAQVAPGVAPLCTILQLVAPPLAPVVRGILPLLEQAAAPTVAGRLAAPLPPPAFRLTPAWEQSWAAGKRNARRLRRLLVPVVVVLPLLRQYENLLAPPLHGLLKLRLCSQRETRRQQQNLCPHHPHSYPRMFPVGKIRLLHLFLLLPQPRLHLLSLLLLCHLVQPARFHRHRHLRQKVFSLQHPPPHPRPNRQLLFPHEALYVRPRSTRRRLCPPCLSHLYCLETLRTGEDPQQGHNLWVTVRRRLQMLWCYIWRHTLKIGKEQQKVLVHTWWDTTQCVFVL